jgi:hypothetical protein
MPVAEVTIYRQLSPPAGWWENQLGEKIENKTQVFIIILLFYF